MNSDRRSCKRHLSLSKSACGHSEDWSAAYQLYFTRGLICGLSAVFHDTTLCRHHMKDLLPHSGPSDLRLSITKTYRYPMLDLSCSTMSQFRSSGVCASLWYGPFMLNSWHYVGFTHLVRHLGQEMPNRKTVHRWHHCRFRGIHAPSGNGTRARARARARTHTHTHTHTHIWGGTQK